MRIIAHLISVVLLVPGIVIAAVLVALGHLTNQPGFLALLTAILDVLLAFLPLAFLTFMVWIGIALMGFSTRFRRAGAIAVGGIAAVTSALMIWLGAPVDDAGDIGIFVPNAGALIIAVWLASTEWT